jgi:hypothetical protein
MQTKKRAMFEFVVPHLDLDKNPARAQFVSDIITRMADQSGRNDNYAVTFRENPPHPGQIKCSRFDRPSRKTRS